MNNRFISKFKSSKGFTLIELLVVIAIIAALAGIMFPVFSQARAKARQISCASNLKQMSQAMLMYAQDNDDVLTGPLFWSGSEGLPCSSVSTVTVFWYHHLWYTYVRNWDVFICPQTRYDIPWYLKKWHGLEMDSCPVWRSPPHTAESRTSGTSYGFNCLFCWGGVLEGLPWNQRTLQRVEKPAQMAALADAEGYAARAYLGPPGNASIDNPGQGGCQGNAYIEPHNGGVNVAFFDGHVKWHKSQQFWAPNYETFLNFLPWSNVKQSAPGW